jgi:hypothetical protein
MIEEAAGTRMYETKKQAAYKTMAKKDTKVPSRTLAAGGGGAVILWAECTGSLNTSTSSYKRRLPLSWNAFARTVPRTLNTKRPAYGRRRHCRCSFGFSPWHRCAPARLSADRD